MERRNSYTTLTDVARLAPAPRRGARRRHMPGFGPARAAPLGRSAAARGALRGRVSRCTARPPGPRTVRTRAAPRRTTETHAGFRPGSRGTSRSPGSRTARACAAAAVAPCPLAHRVAHGSRLCRRSRRTAPRRAAQWTHRAWPHAAAVAQRRAAPHSGRTVHGPTPQRRAPGARPWGRLAVRVVCARRLCRQGGVSDRSVHSPRCGGFVAVPAVLHGRRRSLLPCCLLAIDECLPGRVVVGHEDGETAAEIGEECDGIRRHQVWTMTMRGGASG